MKRIACLAAACFAAAFVAPAPAVAEPAKYLFGAKKAPADLTTASYGGYSKGCLAGARELPETGPGWQAMRLSRNRNWGHPKIIAFIERLSVKAQDIGWAGLYVGDISQPRGGPMRTGHRSHQIGLDVDIWLRAPKRLNLTRAERERISSHIVTTRDGLGVNRYWTRTHHLVLKAAAEDPEVARIFVNPAIKQELCRAEPEGLGRAWLRKIRPWLGHNAHFHVRMNCPAESPDCVAQAPIPAGDGCDEDLAWWFSDEARNPKPRAGGKRPELTMDDLPPACTAVLRK